jgi:uncharacterized protein
MRREVMERMNDDVMVEAVDAKRDVDRLEERIASYGSAVVGFSGGVDSSVVAAAAFAALGERALAVTAVTETLTDADRALTRSLAATLGVSYGEIAYSELEIPNYAENPVNRCYFCKDALYTRLRDVADERGLAVVLDGTNADDAGDYRPGRTAAAERSVFSPLLDLGITKQGVRRLARHYGLANHDKPSSPCLSSRVPYGTPITRAILDRIAAAEERLRALGFRELRVRHHDDVARIEIPRDDFERALLHAERINDELRAVGYRFVSLDLGGFRSGSLNDAIVQITIPVQ